MESAAAAGMRRGSFHFSRLCGRVRRASRQPGEEKLGERSQTEGRNEGRNDGRNSFRRSSRSPILYDLDLLPSSFSPPPPLPPPSSFHHHHPCNTRELGHQFDLENK